MSIQDEIRDALNHCPLLFNDLGSIDSTAELAERYGMDQSQVNAIITDQCRKREDKAHKVLADNYHNDSVVDDIREAIADLVLLADFLGMSIAVEIESE